MAAPAEHLYSVYATGPDHPNHELTQLMVHVCEGRIESVMQQMDERKPQKSSGES